MQTYLMTTSEVAKQLGVSRTTVFNRIQSGQIPASRVGKNYAIRQQDVKRLLSSPLTEADKKRIDQAVDAVVAQYGKVLEWLGGE